MQLARTSLALALAVLPFFAKAEPIPNTPATANVGGKCTITWAPDTTGVWKSMTIELMSGPNSPMTHLKTVATNIDATTLSTFTYPCPAVNPNAPIYFYQFSTAAAPTNLTWSTRFGIADATGKLVPAPIATEPDGSAIPYGNGRLVDPKQADAPPAYLAGNGQNSQLGGGAAPAPVSSAALSSAAPLSSSMPASSAAPSSTTTASSTIESSTTSSATDSAPAVTKTNGAGSIKAGSAALLTGVVALLAGW